MNYYNHRYTLTDNVPWYDRQCNSNKKDHKLEN